MSLLRSHWVQLNPQICDEDNLGGWSPKKTKDVAAFCFWWLAVLNVGGGNIEEVNLKHWYKVERQGHTLQLANLALVIGKAGQKGKESRARKSHLCLWPLHWENRIGGVQLDWDHRTMVRHDLDRVNCKGETMINWIPGWLEVPHEETLWWPQWPRRTELRTPACPYMVVTLLTEFTPWSTCWFLSSKKTVVTGPTGSKVTGGESSSIPILPSITSRAMMTVVDEQAK